MKTKKRLMTTKEPHLIQPWIIQSKAKFGFTQRVVFRSPLKIINSWNVIQRNNQVMPACKIVTLLIQSKWSCGVIDEWNWGNSSNTLEQRVWCLEKQRPFHPAVKSHTPITASRSIQVPKAPFGGWENGKGRKPNSECNFLSNQTE